MVIISVKWGLLKMISAAIWNGFGVMGDPFYWEDWEFWEFY
jgi:hypothetical protein